MRRGIWKAKRQTHSEERFYDEYSGSISSIGWSQIAYLGKAIWVPMRLSSELKGRRGGAAARRYGGVTSWRRGVVPCRRQLNCDCVFAGDEWWFWWKGPFTRSHRAENVRAPQFCFTPAISWVGQHYFTKKSNKEKSLGSSNGGIGEQMVTANPDQSMNFFLQHPL